MKGKMLEPGKYEYAIKENKEDGIMTSAVLEGTQGKTNPLQAVRHIELRMDKSQITAMNLDGDCVVKK